MLCYLPALRDGFALDDVPIIRDNLQIHSLGGILQALALPYWYVEGHLYRPLTTLSFGLEWGLSGGRPLLFHLINLGWHALVTALVVRLSLRWWSPLASAFAGLWFAVHAVHAEAVANIVGRSELVCAAALLGVALIASDQPTADGPARRREWWWVFALTAAAMASKEVGAVAPCIAWAAAITPVRGCPHRDTSSRLAPGWRRRRRRPGVDRRPPDRARFLRGRRAPLRFYARIGHARRSARPRDYPDRRRVAARAAAAAPGLFAGRGYYFPPPIAAVAVGVAIALAAVAVLVWHARRPNPWTLAALFRCRHLRARLQPRRANGHRRRPPHPVQPEHWRRPDRRRRHCGRTSAGAGSMSLVRRPSWRLAACSASSHSARGTIPNQRSRRFATVPPRASLAITWWPRWTTAVAMQGAPGRGHAGALALTPHNPPLLYMAGANALRRRDTTVAFSFSCVDWSRSPLLAPGASRLY